MRATSWLVPLSLLIGGPACAGSYSYPKTETVPVVETRFGVEVADPYRWLENDVRTDEKVREWVRAENATTNAYLDALPGRAILKSRIRALTDFERLGVPRKAGTHYFYTRNDGLQNQSSLWVRDGLAGVPRLLIDPNTWSKDGSVALGEWAASGDGRLLAYAVQDGGSDWRTLRVLDVESGRVLDDRIEWVKFSLLSWKPDGSGFFYSRFDAPAAGRNDQSANLNQAVYFHRIGTPQSDDMAVYRTPDRPQLAHRGQVSGDGRWLIVSSMRSTNPRHEVHALDLAQPGSKPVTLVKGLDHNWTLIGNAGSRFYFITNRKAARQQIVTLDTHYPRRRPEIVVRERTRALAGASMVGAKIVLAYQGDDRADAEMVNLDGTPGGFIRLPGIGTAMGFGGKVGDSETFFSFSSYTTPPTLYRFDTATGQHQVFARPKAAFDPDQFETVQHFYTSKDGTRIPIFIVRKRGIPAGGAPTLLYGYGGFNASQTPGFSAARLAWIEQGGVFAIASLRGGGEFGPAWHDAGRLQNKQNVFDDFIAAGEYLIASGVSAPGKLAAEGRSNGGLLVGAVVNQRPDLFAAALPAVGVMDMLRFDRFTAGRYWVDDYGDPAKETDFRNLHAYSPYHNIRSGVDYPAILVTTSDTDDRVVPAHSFKYAARLQASRIGTRPHLIRIDSRAGHGSGKSVAKMIDESADMYAFAAKWTGLAIAVPGGSAMLAK